jgi:uncharacterized protein YbjT (DUF2867 family)
MEILVTGGTGWFGRPAVQLLVERGHSVRVLWRRRPPPSPVRERVREIRGDLTTGTGLAEAIDGVELVLHAASDPRRRWGAADVEMTRRLLDAARENGVHRVLYVSIVGIDRIYFSYYRHKLECEHQLEASGIPYTIFRATQFHELLAWALRPLERLPFAPLPLDWQFQPIAAADAARIAVDLLASPRNDPRVERGGPAVRSLRELVEVWKRTRRRLRPVQVRLGGRLSRGFRQGRNTVPEHAIEGQTWEEFVAAL